MGVIRSTPNTQVHSKSDKFSDLNYLQTSLCGWQHYMQDYTGYAKINEKVSAFFVIDGHGGPEIAELAAENIPVILKNSDLIRQEQFKAALQNLYETLDQTLKLQGDKCAILRQKYGLPPQTEKYPISGCSIILALVSQNQITISNIGECKSYVCYCSNLSKAVLISGNHTESNTDDQNRVKNAGGYFLNGRVNGMFPFTRSIGDYSFKNQDQKNNSLISSSPSIFSLRKQDIKMVVLGSSGIWQRTNYVLKQLTEDDLQLNQLLLKSQSLLLNLVSKHPKQEENGLRNMGLLIIDLKH